MCVVVCAARTEDITTSVGHGASWDGDGVLVGVAVGAVVVDEPLSDVVGVGQSIGIHQHTRVGEGVGCASLDKVQQELGQRGRVGHGAKLRGHRGRESMRE